MSAVLPLEQILQQIHDKLVHVLAASHVEIIDTTWQHAGHAGNALGGLHLSVSVTSPRFVDMGLIDQHRLVQDVLKDEMQSGLIHALQLKTQKPTA